MADTRCSVDFGVLCHTQGCRGASRSRGDETGSIAATRSVGLGTHRARLQVARSFRSALEVGHQRTAISAGQETALRPHTGGRFRSRRATLSSRRRSTASIRRFSNRVGAAARHRRHASMLLAMSHVDSDVAQYGVWIRWSVQVSASTWPPSRDRCPRRKTAKSASRSLVATDIAGRQARMGIAPPARLRG
jgi:hypothetical protein